jgi:hypothetical protein
MDDWLKTVEELLPESEFWRGVVEKALGSALGRTISVVAIGAIGFLSYIARKPISGAISCVGSLAGTRVAVPLWLLSMLILSAVAWGAFLTYGYRKGKLESEKEPYEEEFTEGEIEDISWKWSWSDGNPTPPNPICPTCGREAALEDSQSIKIDRLEVSGIPFDNKVGDSSYYQLRTDRTVVMCPKHGVVKEWKQKNKSDVRKIVRREIERQVREGEWQNNSETSSFQLSSGRVLI